MTTTPPLDSLGDCVVCGIRTPTRCSECASNGTKWMYFCSREHQKLIYKSHKRVCGKLSSPLRWPELTEKEVKRYLELGAVLDPDSSGKTFAEMAAPSILYGASFSDAFKKVVDFAHEPYGIRGKRWDVAKHESLTNLRMQVHEFKNARLDAIEMDTVTQTKEVEEILYDAANVDTFEMLSYSVDLGWPKLCLKLFDPLMHRCIIAYSFLSKKLSYTAATDEDELEEQERNRQDSPFLRYTFLEVIKLLRTEAVKTHPVEAERLAAVLQMNFVEDAAEESVNDI